jgi:hypothetical protein
MQSKSYACDLSIKVLLKAASTVAGEYHRRLSVGGAFAPICAARAAPTDFDTVFRLKMSNVRGLDPAIL